MWISPKRLDARHNWQDLWVIIGLAELDGLAYSSICKCGKQLKVGFPS